MGKKLSFYFIFSFFLVPFKVFGKNVDRWTRAFFFMFSFFNVPNNCLSESVDRWTSSEHSEKKNQPHLCFIQKCGLADKKLSFNFLFLSCLAPFKIMSKSMYTSNENVENLFVCLLLGFTHFGVTSPDQHIGIW